MPNLSLVRMKELSSFRKIALGTWQTAYDPSIYGTLVLRMDRALAYVERFRAQTGRRLTVSHLMAKASAMALQACPEANAVLRWNRIYLRQRIGVFFQVEQPRPAGIQFVNQLPPAVAQPDEGQ